MKNPLSSQTVGKQSIKSKTNPFSHKVRKKFAKNRKKLWIFNFFAYLCEKIKN